jgi:hypothetical protein
MFFSLLTHLRATPVPKQANKLYTIDNIDLIYISAGVKFLNKNVATCNGSMEVENI